MVRHRVLASPGAVITSLASGLPTDRYAVETLDMRSALEVQQSASVAWVLAPGPQSVPIARAILDAGGQPALAGVGAASEVLVEACAAGRVEVLPSADSPAFCAAVQGMVARHERALSAARELLLVAHELANPLTAARMHTDLLGLDAHRWGADARENLAELTEVIDTLTVLIRGVRHLGKLDMGEIELHRRFPVDLSVLCRQAARHPAVRSGVEVDVPRGIVLSGDQPLLEAALTEVLFNAVKLRNGSVPIPVVASVEGDCALIRVEHAVKPVPASAWDSPDHRYGAVHLHDAKVRAGPHGWAFARRVATVHGGDLRVCFRSAVLMETRLRLPLEGAASGVVPPWGSR